MAKVVYVYDDFALISLGASISGSPSEDAAYPVENVLNPTRKVRYQTTATPGTTVDIDIDLGAAFDTGVRDGEEVKGLALCDLHTDAAYGSGPSIEVLAGATFGTVGAISGATLSGSTYWHLSSDWVHELSAAYALRCWRIRVQANNNRFRLGKVILGRALNFSFLYSPGSELGPPMAPITELETPDGDPVQFVRGPARRRYRFLYGSITDANRQLLDAIRSQTVPMGLIDSLGNSAHVIVRPGGGFTHVFDGLWNGDVDMVQLK